MNTKNTSTWLVRGKHEAKQVKRTENTNPFSDIVDTSIRPNCAVQFGKDRAGLEEEISLEIADDDLIEVTFDDDIVLYLSKPRFEELIGTDNSRSINGKLVIPHTLSIGSEQSRGLGDFVIKTLRVLDVKGQLAKLGAAQIADKLESRLIRQEGLIHWDSASAKWVSAAPEVNAEQTTLLFLHGTASSTAGSFSKLWEHNKHDWQELEAHYGSNIFAFEHKSLSRSPIDNAIALVSALPKGAKLHLVSHSRGGLVGELLCHGDAEQPFDKSDTLFFQPDNNRGLARGLHLLSDEDSQAYQTDASGENNYTRGLQKLSKLLLEKQLKIELFVRVACPARGTTLASERLDLYLSGMLNLLGLVTGLKQQPVYHFLKALTLAVAKERTKPQSLPGLEAMMPSSPFISMLNRPGKQSQSPLAVVKGDIEASGFFRRIGLFLVDSFYQTDHDLVVDTNSMEGGLSRSEGGLKVLFDQGTSVNHFNYFSNDKTRNAILRSLQKGQANSSFTLPDVVPELPRSWSRGSQTTPKPIVFVVPGISGTNLEVNGKRIWVDMKNLFLGKFKHLRIENLNVEAKPVIAEFYNHLIDFLSDSHEVIAFPYDWRLSILQASERLEEAIEDKLNNTDQPVRIIGHSMGGLVARGFIANRPDLWKRMTAHEGAPLLMLGTPNQGSYSITRLLSGDDTLSSMLSLIDIQHDENQWLEYLSAFPGVLELLPRHGDIDFSKAEIWHQLKTAKDNQQQASADDFDEFNPPTPWPKPLMAALKKADQTWKHLESVNFDQRYVRYIAGKAKATPIAMSIEDECRIKYSAVSEGDGRVPWAYGIPQNIPHWFVNAEHGDLANYPPAFNGILDIITTGDTNTLSNRPVSRSLTTPATFDLPKERIITYPNRNDLYRGLLGSNASGIKQQQTSIKRLAVSVVHGNLGFAKSPVAVGHYQGHSIISAERALDFFMDYRLSDRHQVGLYPGALQSSDVIIDKNRHNKLSGAIIIGLGKLGSLSVGGLTDSTRDAFLKYALICNELLDQPRPPIILTSLLIGSGSGGLRMEDSINAILQATIDANRILSSKKKPIIDGIQFIELFEENAALAQRIVWKLAQHSKFQTQIDINRCTLSRLDGGRKLISRLDDENWWEQLQISSTKDGSLDFTYLTKRARAEHTMVDTQRRSIDRILQQATLDSVTDSRLSQTLFELLLPRDFKHHVSDQRNMLLLVDEKAACYPWELLEYQGDDVLNAPSTEAGMIRQLLTSDFTRKPRMSNTQTALIVGDPSSGKDAQPLPGAQKEAAIVNKLLTAHNFTNSALINSSSLDVITSLMTAQYKILHLAGHGVFEYYDKYYDEDDIEKPITGMVLGDGIFLTPSEIAQMPSTPELVFINCCFLGKADDSRPELSRDRHRLAANISTQLIREGVIAVVAAGWVVDDAAAELFAQTFYSHMLAGETFGIAVQKARHDTKQRYPDKNTWGAYQCYGDPHYRLSNIEAKLPAQHTEQCPFVCKSEVITKLCNLQSDAKTANKHRSEQLLEKVLTIESNLPTKWLTDAEVQQALGAAYAELGDFAQAIAAYQKSAAAEVATISIKTLEQLSSLQIRHATELLSTFDDEKIQAQANNMISEAIKRLLDLSSVSADTTDRLALLGGAYKRIAQHKSGRERREYLSKMQSYYGQADQHALQAHSGEVYAYTRHNFLTARLVLSQISSAQKYQDMDDFPGLLLELYNCSDTPQFQDDAFWSGINHLNTMLLQALSQKTLNAKKQEIIDHYLEQGSRTVSAKQFRSVTEHFNFLIQMYDQTKNRRTQNDLSEIMQGIVESWK